MRKFCIVAATIAMLAPGAALARPAPACNSIIDAAAIKNACGADTRFRIKKESARECTGKAANTNTANLNLLSFTIGTMETDEKAAKGYASWLKAVRADLAKGDGSVVWVEEIDGIGAGAFMRERPSQLNDLPEARELRIFFQQGNHLVKLSAGSGLMGQTPICDEEQLKSLAREVAGRIGH
jgi:hypothetical protein